MSKSPIRHPKTNLELNQFHKFITDIHSHWITDDTESVYLDERVNYNSKSTQNMPSTKSARHTTIQALPSRQMHAPLLVPAARYKSFQVFTSTLISRNSRSFALRAVTYPWRSYVRLQPGNIDPTLQIFSSELSTF